MMTPTSAGCWEDLQDNPSDAPDNSTEHLGDTMSVTLSFLTWGSLFRPAWLVQHHEDAQGGQRGVDLSLGRCIPHVPMP